MENLSAAIAEQAPNPCFRQETSKCKSLIGFASIASRSIKALNNNSVRAIELLQERRSALISAAVTGQIDVRRAS